MKARRSLPTLHWRYRVELIARRLLLLVTGH